MTKKKTVELKATAALVLDGEIVRPGAVITVSDSLARNLLHRGRAILATAAEAGDETTAAAKPKGGAKAKADKPAADASTAGAGASNDETTAGE